MNDADRKTDWRDRRIQDLEQLNQTHVAHGTAYLKRIAEQETTIGRLRKDLKTLDELQGRQLNHVAEQDQMIERLRARIEELEEELHKAEARIVMLKHDLSGITEDQQTSAAGTGHPSKAKLVAGAIREVIRLYSLENGSNTPDWVLAKYLLDCLAAAEALIGRRDSWYSIKPAPGWKSMPQGGVAKGPVAARVGEHPSECTIRIHTARIGEGIAERLNRGEGVVRGERPAGGPQETEELKRVIEVQADELARKDKTIDILTRELNAIDAALGNRAVFDNFRYRSEKVAHACREAAKADHCERALEGANQQVVMLKSSLHDARGQIRELERRLSTAGCDNGHKA